MGIGFNLILAPLNELIKQLNQDINLVKCQQLDRLDPNFQNQESMLLGTTFLFHMKPGAAAAAAATVDLKSFQTYCFRLHRSITANASWRAGVSNRTQ